MNYNRIFIKHPLCTEYLHKYWIGDGLDNPELDQTPVEVYGFTVPKERVKRATVHQSLVKEEVK